MKKADIYTTKGNKSGSMNLPNYFEEPVNKVLLAQAIRVYEDRRHPGLSKTKTRGEVNLSTRKIYRQKGTGLARHGARSAPIFVGGGKAHGPKGLKRVLKLPKKMRGKALNIALSIKANEGSVFVVTDLGGLKKTGETALLIDKIKAKVKVLNKNAKFLFVLSDESGEVGKVIRNIENADYENINNLNAYSVFFSDVLIIEKKALEKFNKQEIKEQNPEKSSGNAKNTSRVSTTGRKKTVSKKTVTRRKTKV